MPSRVHKAELNFFAERVDALYEKSLVRLSSSSKRMATYFIAGTVSKEDDSISD